MRFFLPGVLCVVGSCTALAMAAPENTRSLAAQVDSDHDGIDDFLENSLLRQFQPKLFISSNDCAGKPARFEPNRPVPTVEAADGTVYGQAFPKQVSQSTGIVSEIELNYYHLWGQDCGEMGHRLDAEHVSVLVRAHATQPGDSDGQATAWTALYWYAAAHEDTVCDASQISRASTLNATTHGASIWISGGKHASFLDEQLCHRGCGGDQCRSMETLVSPHVENLGEIKFPASGTIWSHSREWPLAAKMERTDFTTARLMRVDHLPDTDILWVNPAKRPAQAVFLGGNAAISGVADSGRSTDVALVQADDQTVKALGGATANTHDALGSAAADTGRALGKSSRNVWHALGRAAEHTKDALAPGQPKP